MRVQRAATGLLFLCIGIGGCGSEGGTNRLDPDAEAPIEGFLTSQDFRSIAQNMTRSLIQAPRIAGAPEAATLTFKTMRNNTDELINTDMFLDRMRSEMIRFAEGRIRFLDRESASEVVLERAAKERGEVTRSGEKPMLGADFFLTGQVDNIPHTAGRAKVAYYRFSFRLTDADSTEVVWQDEYEFKKYKRDGITH